MKKSVSLLCLIVLAGVPVFSSPAKVEFRQLMKTVPAAFLEGAYVIKDSIEPGENVVIKNGQTPFWGRHCSLWIQTNTITGNSYMYAYLSATLWEQLNNKGTHAISKIAGNAEQTLMVDTAKNDDGQLISYSDGASIISIRQDNNGSLSFYAKTNGKDSLTCNNLK